jgi:protein TonB
MTSEGRSAPPRGTYFVVPVTHTPVPPIVIPDHLPPIDFTRPPTDEHDFDGKTGRLTTDGPGGGIGLASPTNDVYSAALVEKAAAPQPGNPAPVYPAAMRSAQIEGTVLATFVVDTMGRAEPATIHVAEATHPLFGEAVRQSLLRSRYLPAIVGGRPVRQLVEQRFSFTLNR